MKKVEKHDQIGRSEFEDMLAKIIAPAASLLQGQSRSVCWTGSLGIVGRLTLNAPAFLCKIH